jgi:integrase
MAKRRTPKKLKLHGGVIRKRADGRWEWRGTQLNGKRVSLVARTESDLRERVKPYLDQRGGKIRGAVKQTVETFLRGWLASNQSDRRASTNTLYSRIVGNIVKRIGDLPMEQLNAESLKGMFAEMRVEGVSTANLRKTHDMLAGALGAAMAEDVLLRDPLKAVPRPKHTEKRFPVLSAVQSAALLTRAKEHPLGAFVILALRTGLRRGELCGLQSGDLDFERGELHVRRQVLANGSVGPPKTTKSLRTILLDQACLATLRDRVRAIEAETDLRRERKGNKHLAHRRALRKAKRIRDGLPPSAPKALHVESPWLFAAENGAVPSPRNLVLRVFKELLKEAGLPLTVRLHDLRATHATLAIEAGIDAKTVSERLGHTTVRMTLDRYTHPSRLAHAKAADMVGGVFDAALAALDTARDGPES